MTRNIPLSFLRKTGKNPGAVISDEINIKSDKAECKQTFKYMKEEIIKMIVRAFSVRAFCHDCPILKTKIVESVRDDPPEWGINYF